MIRSKLTELKKETKVQHQAALKIQEIVVREYFPETNSVSVSIANLTVKGRSGDRLYPLGYRSDVSEMSPPQPGDRGVLISTGWQRQSGFVLLTHSPGGEATRQYIPIRGGWGV